MIKRAIGLLLAGCLFGACALTQKGEDVSRVFVLRPIEKKTEVLQPPLPARIAIALPTAAPGLDTEKIILFTSSQALDFYANAEWATRLPEMVRSAMVGSFENSARFTAVVPDSAGLPANYLLMTEIRRFEAQYTADKTTLPTANVTFVTKLISLPSREVLKSFEQTASVPAAQDKIAEVVDAFDQAFAQTQNALIEEVARTSLTPLPLSKKRTKR